MIRIYCDRHKQSHHVASYGRRVMKSSSDPAGTFTAWDHLPLIPPALDQAVWCELLPPMSAARRRQRQQVLADGGGTAAMMKEPGGLHALLGVRTDPTRDVSTRKASQWISARSWLDGEVSEAEAERSVSANRCDRCGFSVPRRGEKLAPILDMLDANDITKLSLRQLRSAVDRWDAQHS